MARKYLSHVDLNKNQLQNAVIHPLGTAPSSPTAGQIYFNNTGGSENMYYYDGSNWQSFAGDVRGIVTSTANQISLTNAGGPTPSVDIITGAVTSSGTGLATGQQIYDFVYANAQEVTVNGTTNEIEVTTSGGSAAGKIGPSDSVTIGLPADVTISNDLTVNGNVTLGNATSDTVVIAGNLTVNGTTTSVNSNEVNIGDAIILLNSDEAGTPSQNAGIEIERGTSTNVSLRWNESTDEWEFTSDGSSYTTLTGEEPDATESVKGVVELATPAEALAGSDTSRVVTPAGLAARSYAQSIGDGSNTSYTVTHSLNTMDVIIQLYDNSTYDTVYADVVRTNTTTATITFTSAPSSNDIRVLVTKVD